MQALLEQIQKSVESVNDLVAEVTAASQEQTKGVDQITIAVSQMDAVTQSNAANAEENAASSEELSSQAQSLNTTVAALAQLVSGGNGNGHGTGATSAKLETFQALHHPHTLALQAPAPQRGSNGPARQAKSGNGNSHAEIKAPGSLRKRIEREQSISHSKDLPDLGDNPDAHFREI